jgi:ribonuclease BN (tRNA processing enzyme)
MACDHAIASNVKSLYLTHHDPWSSDEILDNMEKRAMNYIKEKGRGDIIVKVAREGYTF